MYRVDHFTGTRTLAPPTPQLTNDGLYFTAGDPGVGGVGAIPATVAESEWLNMIQEELCNIVTAAGEDIDKSDRTQLARCIYTVSHPDTGGGPVGPRMQEPPATNKPYARFYNGIGQWLLAMEEPETEGRPHARVGINPGTGAGAKWVAASGVQRPPEDADEMNFYVSRVNGSDTDGDGSLGRPWLTIQAAVDEVCSSWDADGKVFNINVDDDQSGMPWEGFTVFQPLLNAPRMGFRIKGTDGTGGARKQCRIGPCRKPGYETYCVFVCGGQVALDGFCFDQPADTIASLTRNYGRATVCAEGGDSTIWFMTNCSFYGTGSNASSILATEHANIIIDDHIILAGGFYGESATPAKNSNQDNTFRSIIAATLCGQVHIEDRRTEMGVDKEPAYILVESAITAEGNVNAVAASRERRVFYAGQGAIISFGDTGEYRGGGFPQPAFTVRTTGIISAGDRAVQAVLGQSNAQQNVKYTGGMESTWTGTEGNPNAEPAGAGANFAGPQ
jgi:hypothetical protein